VWALFREHGIELPYPQRDLHLRSSAELERIMALLDSRGGNPAGPE